MNKIKLRMPFIRSGTSVLVEFLVRIAVVSAFCYLETVVPFERVIHPNTLVTDCKYPRHDSYVPGRFMWCMVVSVPCFLSLLAWAGLSDTNDAMELLLSWSLSVGLTGVITDMMKVIVGRHRPDFYYRCFPDGIETPDFTCTGDPSVIMEGRKSFPSGHSSLSFCSFGFASLWLAGRLEILSSRRGSGARVCACLAPLVIALCVALSRTCDYHHHWQDVLVGSLIGFLMSLFCYRQYYNPISSEMSGIPYVISNTYNNRNSRSDSSPSKDLTSEATPLLVNGGFKKVDKWI